MGERKPKRSRRGCQHFIRLEATSVRRESNPIETLLPLHFAGTRDRVKLPLPAAASAAALPSVTREARVQAKAPRRKPADSATVRHAWIRRFLFLRFSLFRLRVYSLKTPTA